MLDGETRNEDLKIFVGGLPQSTTKETLNDHFTVFGHVDSYVMMDKFSGRSRGFGFVNFRDPQDMKTVLELEHTIDGVSVTCSEYKNKGCGKGGGGAIPPPYLDVAPVGLDDRMRTNPEMKVFVGGLSQDTTKEILNTHFLRYGEADSYIMMDKTTGRSRGFGFVNFRDFDTLDAALQEVHEVDGVAVAVTEYHKGSGKGSQPVGYGPVASNSVASSHHRHEARPQSNPMGGHGPASSSRHHIHVPVHVDLRSKIPLHVDLRSQKGAQPHVQHSGVWEEPQTSGEIKIFVGGIPQETTKETLNNYFSQYGCADAYIMMDRANGRSRGFGFVNFTERRVKQTVLRSQPHVIDGCHIECRDYEKGGEKGSSKGTMQLEDFHSPRLIRPPSTSHRPGKGSTGQDATDLMSLVGEQLQVLTTALTQQPAKGHGRSQPVAQNLQSAVSSVIAALKPVAVAAGVSLPAAPSAQAPSAQASGGQAPAHGSDSYLKIFVGGLKQETTKGALDAYFNEYGVADSYIMMDKATGRSRGFGFVNFRDEWVKYEVLNHPSHAVDGAPITCSDYADGKGKGGRLSRQDGGLLREESQRGYDQPPHPDDARIFVGGLAQISSDATLWECFELYGLVSCEVMIDKMSGRSRGFAYLQFDSPSSAQKAIASQPFVIDGKQVELKACWGKGQGKGSGKARFSVY